MCECVCVCVYVCARMRVCLKKSLFMNKNEKVCMWMRQTGFFVSFWSGKTVVLPNSENNSRENVYFLNHFDLTNCKVGIQIQDLSMIVISIFLHKHVIIKHALKLSSMASTIPTHPYKHTDKSCDRLTWSPLPGLGYSPLVVH